MFSSIFVLCRIGLALLMFSLLSCAPHKPAPQVPFAVPKNRPAFNLTELEQEIHSLINQERRDKGLTPLAWNHALSKIARKHSRDMAGRNYFSHYSPEGHDFFYRYQQEDFTCSVKVERVIYQGAENIFQNNLYDRIMVMNGVKYYDWNTIKHIAETTVRGWMNSPGHRKNILTPAWKSEGIGIAVSEDDKIYITQNFC